MARSRWRRFKNLTGIRVALVFAAGAFAAAPSAAPSPEGKTSQSRELTASPGTTRIERPKIPGMSFASDYWETTENNRIVSTGRDASIEAQGLK